MVDGADDSSKAPEVGAAMALILCIESTAGCCFRVGCYVAANLSVSVFLVSKLYEASILTGFGSD